MRLKRLLIWFLWDLLWAFARTPSGDLDSNPYPSSTRSPRPREGKARPSTPKRTASRTRGEMRSRCPRSRPASWRAARAALIVCRPARWRSRTRASTGASRTIRKRLRLSGSSSRDWRLRSRGFGRPNVKLCSRGWLMGSHPRRSPKRPALRCRQFGRGFFTDKKTSRKRPASSRA